MAFLQHPHGDDLNESTTAVQDYYTAAAVSCCLVSFRRATPPRLRYDTIVADTRHFPVQYDTRTTP